MQRLFQDSSARETAGTDDSWDVNRCAPLTYLRHVHAGSRQRDPGCHLTARDGPDRLRRAAACLRRPSHACGQGVH